RVVDRGDVDGDRVRGRVVVADDGVGAVDVTGVETCALPLCTVGAGRGDELQVPGRDRRGGDRLAIGHRHATELEGPATGDVGDRDRREAELGRVRGCSAVT